MHIICFENEMTLINKMVEQGLIPDETYIVETNEHDEYNTPLFRHVVRDNTLTTVVDFEAKERSFSDEEEEEQFLETVSVNDSIKFLIEYEESAESSTPYRYHHAHDNNVCGNFDHLRIGMGHYVNDNLPYDMGTSDHNYNFFTIDVPKNVANDTVKEIINSIYQVLNYQIERHPNITKHFFDVFEYTLSDGGRNVSFFIELDGDKKPANYIVSDSYSSDKEFDDIELAIKYISKHHWYE